MRRNPLNPVPILGLTLASLLFTGCSPDNNPVPKPVSERSTANEQPAYMDTTLDIDTRVDDLVSRMDLAEKISQMYNESPAIEHLGIAEYDWWNEALHGVARAGKATVFPQAIGMAAMWDRETMFDIAEAVSDEARAKHHYFVENGVHFRYTGLTFWSPNINIFRDPRWGRGQETYGEDPYLTGELALPYISGLQGENPKYLKTAAMAKHFAVHSGPEKSRHSDNYIASPKDLNETYLPAFEKAVVEGDVESVMCAYNRVNDEPACGNDMLLKETLRGKWGFKGHVVSDCGAIADFYAPEAHHVVMAPAAAAAWAVRSGTDLNCGTDRLSTFANLHFALQREMITQDEIDQSVKRLMKTRFKLGMFDPDDQVPYSKIPMDVVGSQAHLALTQKAAEKSFVLLKNSGILPLKKSSKVAIIGPNATNPTVLVGNYFGDPIKPVTPLDGIQQYLGEENVFYAPGSALAGDTFSHYQVISADHFFHKDDNGALKPGLQANYYNASAKEGREEVPVFSRVDANIDFFWQRSPVDNTVRDEFAVEWSGVLIPKESGVYQFSTRETLKIDGEEVKDGIYLNANQEYAFEASQKFVHAFWGQPLEAYAKVSWLNSSRNLVADAVAAAQKADVIIFTGGISADLEGEEMSVEIEGFDHGDRTDIRLPEPQRKLLATLKKLNKPIVLVNFSGSAIALNWANNNVDAILQGFYPGEATGTALARILWGEVSPSGRLPITFYRSLDDLPGFKDYAMTNRTYKYYEGDVLYPFGYGLSYTQFAYSELSAPATMASGEPLAITAQVSNSGEVASDEVVQVYVSMKVPGLSLPQRELKEFKRIYLEPGASQTVEFSIAGKDLSYVDDQGVRHPYHGPLTLSVGGGQQPYVSATGAVSKTITIEQ